VTLESALILDPLSAALPVPTTRVVGGLTFREIQMLPYPFFADLRAEQLNREHPVTAGLQQMIVSWPSPLRLDEEKTAELTVTRLMTTSERSWTDGGTNILPDFENYPAQGFASPAEREAQLVAVAL